MLMSNMLKTDAFLRKTLERRMTGEYKQEEGKRGQRKAKKGLGCSHQNFDFPKKSAFIAHLKALKKSFSECGLAF